MSCELATIGFEFQGQTLTVYPSAQTYKEIPINATQNYRAGFFSGKYMYGRSFSTVISELDFFQLKAIELKSRRLTNQEDFSITVLDQYQPFVEIGIINTRPLADALLPITSVGSGVIYYGRFQCSISVEGQRVGYDPTLKVSVYDVTIVCLEVEPLHIVLSTSLTSSIRLHPIKYATAYVDQYESASPKVRSLVSKIPRELYRKFEISALVNRDDLAKIATLKSQSERITLGSLPAQRLPLSFEDNYELNRIFTVYLTETHNEIAIDQFEVSLTLTQAIGERTITFAIGTNSLIFEPLTYSQSFVDELKSKVSFSAIAQAIETGAIKNANRAYQISGLFSAAQVAKLRSIKDQRETYRTDTPPVLTQIKMTDLYNPIAYTAFDVFLDIGTINEIENNLWEVAMTVVQI
jgi:hypothetical protein